MERPWIRDAPPGVRGLRRAVGNPAAVMVILLMTGSKFGLPPAVALLMLPATSAQSNALELRRHQDAMRTVAVVHIVLASAVVVGSAQLNTRLQLWTAAATLLGIEAVSIGVATLATKGLAPLIGSTLLALRAIDCSRSRGSNRPSAGRGVDLFRSPQMAGQ